MSDITTQNRRLHILKCLKISTDYRMSDLLLQEMLKKIGFASPLAVIKADLAWLEQLGLLSTQELPGMTIALLCSEGVDVADGLSHVPGIARPRPE